MDDFSLFISMATITKIILIVHPVYFSLYFHMFFSDSLEEEVALGAEGEGRGQLGTVRQLTHGELITSYIHQYEYR